MLKILWPFSSKLQLFSCKRMDKFQGCGMKRLTAWTLICPTIHLVSHYRIATMSQMNTYLMGTACFQPKREKAKALALL